MSLEKIEYEKIVVGALESRIQDLSLSIEILIHARKATKNLWRKLKLSFEIWEKTRRLLVVEDMLINYTWRNALKKETRNVP